MTESRFDQEALQFAKSAKDFAQFKEAMNDPVVVGSMLFPLSQERTETNEILLKINKTLDSLDARISALESGPVAKVQQAGVHVAEEHLLSDADEKIVSIVSKLGRANAKQVQTELGYKGSNAASSRLNALCRSGVFRKLRAGKVVYFAVTESHGNETAHTPHHQPGVGAVNSPKV